MAEVIDKLLNDVNTQFDESDKKLNSPQPERLEIPDDLNAIKNAYLTVQHYSDELADDMEERVNTIDKNNLIMVLLNYKIYETRYDFSSTVAQLREERRRLEALDVTDELASQISFKIVEIINSIAQREEEYQKQHSTIKEQILRAQSSYEHSISVLDDCLERLKKNFDYLSLLAEAEKAHITSKDDAEENVQLQHLEQAIDHFTELQTSGWRTSSNITSPEAKGLTITENGMLKTSSGRLITYMEAREQNLLDNMRISDFIKESVMDTAKEEMASVRSKSEEGTSSSVKSKMSSEDVAYLIEHLGTPLTLALAEITAVQPSDPIHYLGHWLFKYLYNREVSDIERVELDQLTDERTRLATDKWHKFVEEEARAAVVDMIARAEEQAIHAELLRIERELIEQEQEEEILDDEARDKFGPYDENVGLKL